MFAELLALVSPGAYGASVAVGTSAIIGALFVVRRVRLGSVVIRWSLAGLLMSDVVAYLVSDIRDSSFHASTSLPLALCNMAVVVAALACVSEQQVLVDITYFVGLAGTVQGLATPDLSAPYPSLVFFEYVVGHLAVIAAAIVLVVGERLRPSRGAVWRTYGIVAGYTAIVGAIDATTGANYMFLRRQPSESTLLSVLGPYPWYILSAAAVAIGLFAVLDLPFVIARHDSSRVGAFSLAYTAWIWTITVAVGLVVWPAMLVSPKRWRWGLLRLAGRTLATLGGISIDATRDSPSSRPCLFVANHASYVDGLALALTMPRPGTFIVGAAIRKQRIAGTFMHALGSEFVGPASGDSVHDQLRRLRERIAGGYDLIGFPEGGLGSDGALKPFRSGLFLVAMESHVEVVPVAICGSAGVVRPHSKRVSRHAIEVYFGEPIAPPEGGYGVARALAQTVRATIETMLHGQDPMSSFETAAEPAGLDDSATIG